MTTFDPSRRNTILHLLKAGSASLLGLGSLASCGSSSEPTDTAGNTLIKPLGDRVVGLFALGPEAGDFGPDVIQRIINSGATSTTLSVYWDNIEPEPFAYIPEPNLLATGEQFYPPFDISVTLGFSVIDTNNKRLPQDLTGRSFDDPVVIARFNDMLDWAITQVPSVDAHVITIGNEVDVYLNAHPEEWPAWQTFFEQTAAHARMLWPNAVIGCKATYGGIMTEPSASALTALNQSADGVFVTYYAIESDFTVSPSGTVIQAMDAMALYAGNSPLYILEHGCPSSGIIGSSETLQADFISQTFEAWDKHADQIRHIEFFALHDLTPVQVAFFESYYGISDNRFAAYLGTLGLRSSAGAGVDKLAWDRFKSEVAVR